MPTPARWQVAVWVVVTAVVVAACAQSSPRASVAPTLVPSADSGIEGITEADPQCPVVGPGVACPPKPVSKTVAVVDPNGAEITRFTSNSDGLFRVGLPPGTYRLQEVVDPPSAPPSLKPITVEVLQGKFTHLALLFDTGIR